MPSNKESEAARNATIVVVDDDIGIARMVVMQLQEGGYSAVPFGDPCKALEAIKLSAPGLIISDIRMPNLTGPEMIMAAKKCGRVDDLKVLFISSARKEEYTPELRELLEGGAGILQKPHDMDRLLREVKLRLNGHNSPGLPIVD